MVQWCTVAPRGVPWPLCEGHSLELLILSYFGTSVDPTNTVVLALHRHTNWCQSCLAFTVALVLRRGQDIGMLAPRERPKTAWGFCVSRQRKVLKIDIKTVHSNSQ